jgi:excisionase family DNA binding protein
VALALRVHVQRLRHEGQVVPPEVVELTSYVTGLAKMRQDALASADWPAVVHHAPVPERLLVTKGEAAERLGVSVRTIERLVATGRLRQVHVERLARFRVRDLEVYVDGLDDDGAPDDHSAATADD